MSKNSLVVKHYDDYGNVIDIQDVFLDKNNFESIVDIDKYTSLKEISDFWSEIFSYNDYSKFSSVFIKSVDNDNIKYYNVILNNKAIYDCANDVNDKNIINKDNKFFKKEFREFIKCLFCYDLKFFKENLDIDDEYFRCIYNFKYNKDLDSYNALLNLFSNYLFFRDWISNRNKLKKDAISFNNRKEENNYDYKFKNYNHKFDNNYSFYDDDFFDMNLIKRKVKYKQL